MIKQHKLEDLIREKIPLGNPTAKGFHPLKCAVCNDYKQRGGFKFENGEVGYNCFNCGKSARYEEMSGHISRGMRHILNAFGIDDTDINAVINSAFFVKKPDTGQSKISLNDLKKIDTFTPTIKLPPKSIKLGDTTEFLDNQEKIVSYLLDRKVDINRYVFFFSPEKKFINHVIIPFYRNGSLIFWQARNIDNTAKKRYENSAVSRDAVIFNFDQIYSYSAAPLFVCEGVFDAMMFDGIAIIGSKLSNAKVELLKRARRRLIFVIDKDSNGAQLAEQVLKYGWEITFAPDGATDVNNSVQRFGKTYTAFELMRNIPKDESSAKLAISIKCR